MPTFCPSTFRPFSARLAGLTGLAILLLGGGATSARAQGRIEARLSFSVDNGKTFSAEPVTLPAPGVVLVKADFEVKGETRPVQNGAVVSNLRSEEGDFASANVGRQSFTGKPAYYQRLQPFWFNAAKPGTALYPLDLGMRPDGVMGSGNKWDHEKKAFVDAPLPPVLPRSPGKHLFILRLNYRVNGEPEPIATEHTFSVTIGTAGGDTAQAKTTNPAAGAQAAPTHGNMNTLQPDAPRLAPLSGTRVWPASSWQPLDGGKLTSVGPFVRPQFNQDAAVRLDQIAPGAYFLRLQTEVGSKHGEEELLREEPYLFVNGVPVDFGRATPPVPAEGRYVGILESRVPVALKPGDQLRFNSMRRGGKLVGGLAIASAPLPNAPLDVRPFYDPAMSDMIRVSGTWEITPGSENGASGKFQLQLRNVTGHASTLAGIVEVRDYWNRVVAQSPLQLQLADRQTHDLGLAFVPGYSDRYRAIVKINGAGGGAAQERVFETLVDNPRGARPRLWLNTGWEWASRPDDGTLQSRVLPEAAAPPDNLTWQPVELPASWQDSRPGDHLAWYKRTISAPAWAPGRRLFLRFTRVAYEGRVYLNGALLTEHFGQNGAFEAEVTGKLRPGANELLLAARDGLAALEPAELGAQRVEISQRSRYRAPLPLKAGIGEVWLYGAGEVPVQDVFVQTSYRARQLTVDIQTPPLPAGVTSTISNRVLFEGKEVLRLPDTAAPAAGGTVSVTQPWANPLLWEAEAPRLLQLVTELRDAQGQLLDRRDTRFGFREFWPEGDRLMWNGTPVKFAAIPFLSTWGWSLTERNKRPAIREILLLSKRMGATMQRHVYDPEYRAEMNDEEGIVMAQAFGGVVYPTRQIVESDEFWAHAARFDAELIRATRNSPSIVTWYLSNEFWGAHEPENQKRLLQLGRQLAPMDPTRIFEFGCDLDVGGYATINSTHYPVDLRALREEPGVMPEAAYWRPLDRQLRVGESVPAGLMKYVANVKGPSPITWGKKPLIVNETLWNFFFNPPDGFSRLSGDEPYKGGVATERAFQEAGAWFIRGHRDAGASVITPWENINRDPLKRGIPAVEINPVQRYAHFFGGQSIPFEVNLHHDRFRPARLQFTWSLLQGTKVLGSSSKEIPFGSGELVRQNLQVPLPPVQSRTGLQLVLTLREGPAQLRRVELPIYVYPLTAPVWPANARIGLYDPSGITRGALEELGANRAVNVPVLSAGHLQNLDALIVGANAASSSDAAAQRALQAFVDHGGRVLVLNQDKAPALLPVQLRLTSLVANQLWSFRPGHPLLRGLFAEDYANWFPTQRTGANFYLKPEAGNWRTVLESGGPNGLIYSGLLETEQGNGRLICSQPDLLSNVDKNPQAARLWSNLLSYLAQPVARAPHAGYWAAKNGAMERGLVQLRAQLQTVNSPAQLAELDTLLLDASLDLKGGEVTAVRQFVERGGKLFLHGVSPANRQMVSTLCGAPVRVLASVPPAWSGRAIRLGHTEPLAGVTNFDLFWKKRPDTEDYSANFVTPASTLASLGEWTLEAEGGQPLVYPGYLLQVAAGRGSILLSSLQWDTAPPSVSIHARRIASALLTNLGVRLEPARQTVLPEKLTYRPVEIAPLLNRGFADDVADDGKGGWTDQGPDADLRTFPTDAPIQTFRQVPFRIEKGPSVLVMASQHRQAGPPASAEITIGSRADVLFFLQSSAWTSRGRHGSYVVQYADGSQYEIILSGEINLRDWAAANSGDSFPLETDTITRVAWTGNARTLPTVSLYVLAWPNPFPERPIRSVTLKSDGKAVLALVGVTVGMVSGEQPSGALAGQSGANSLPQKAGAGADRAKAQRALAAGKAARQAGQLDTAARHFEDAITADPASTGALLELGSLREASGRWNDAALLYQRVVQLEPDHLEARFRLGRAYEEAGQWDKAEKAYRDSLEANRNQPEILRALALLAQRRPKN